MFLIKTFRYRIITHTRIVRFTSSGGRGENMTDKKVGDDVPDLASMRMPYKQGHETFSEAHLVCKEPIGQFAAWLKDACEHSDIGEGNAMTIATADKDGRPSARILLLKGFSKKGFQFYTNYGSRKGQELASNPYAALVFFWEPLHRSVRVQGSVEKVSVEESTEYFRSRPRESQISACASKQSSVIESRDVLTKKTDELRKLYADKEVPKPENWGGFLVKPEVVEFWQGQSTRAHDRIQFRRPKNGEVVDEKMTHTGDDGWVYERLSP